MRLKTRMMILFGFLSLYMMFMGVQGIVEAAKYKSQETITLKDLLAKKPDAGWYKVTGGFLSIAEGAHTYKEGQKDTSEPTEVYIPYRDATLLKDDSKLPTRVDVLVRTTRPDAVQLYSKMRSMDPSKLKAEDVFLKRDVSCMVATGLHDFSKETITALKKAMPDIADDCVMLNEDEKPSSGVGVGMLLGGLGFGAVVTLVGLATRASRRL